MKALRARRPEAQVLRMFGLRVKGLGFLVVLGLRCQKIEAGWTSHAFAAVSQRESTARRSRKLKPKVSSSLLKATPSCSRAKDGFGRSRGRRRKPHSFEGRGIHDPSTLDLSAKESLHPKPKRSPEAAKR